MEISIQKLALAFDCFESLIVASRSSALGLRVDKGQDKKKDAANVYNWFLKPKAFQRYSEIILSSFATIAVKGLWQDCLVKRRGKLQDKYTVAVD